MLCLMRKPAVTPHSATALAWQLISDHLDRQATATKEPALTGEITTNNDFECPQNLW